jgi:hypothetical protein
VSGLDRVHLEALRAASALQLCVLDRRYDDARVIIASLDPDVLRATVLEAVVIWSEAAVFAARGAGLRDAVAADALDQAAIDPPG